MTRAQRYKSTVRGEVLGRWPTAREAAIARDRAVLFYGLDLPLRDPRASRARGPASPAELRREASALAKRGAASKFIGVWPAKTGAAWVAYANVKRRLTFLGTFASEEAAALARDRVERYLRPKTARLNFPAWRVVPATVEAMRREARAALKANRSSRYEGVSYDAARVNDRPWAASITVGARKLPLGRWSSERDAAHAYDRAALHYVGAPARLNLPRRKPAPADSETLMAEARAERKARTSSAYLGVMWHRKGRKWMARFGPKYLGLYDDERDAALAYDDEVFAAQGERARLNFDRRTGAFVGGRRGAALASGRR